MPEPVAIALLAKTVYDAPLKKIEERVRIKLASLYVVIFWGTTFLTKELGGRVTKLDAEIVDDTLQIFHWDNYIRDGVDQRTILWARQHLTGLVGHPTAHNGALTIEPVLDREYRELRSSWNLQEFEDEPPVQIPIRCAQCQGNLIQKEKGRYADYCSKACSQRAYRARKKARTPE